jgi:predicted transcriptional regulator
MLFFAPSVLAEDAIGKAVADFLKKNEAKLAKQKEGASEAAMGAILA